jgi:hypothetical protein
MGWISSYTSTSRPVLLQLGQGRMRVKRCCDQGNFTSMPMNHQTVKNALPAAGTPESIFDVSQLKEAVSTGLCSPEEL